MAAEEVDGQGRHRGRDLVPAGVDVGGQVEVPPARLHPEVPGDGRPFGLAPSFFSAGGMLSFWMA